MYIKISKNEKSAIAKYCIKNNIIDCVMGTLEEVINDFNNLESDHQFLTYDYLNKTIQGIQFVADWFNIELCYNIMSRGEVEEITKQQLRKSFDKQEELDLYTMKMVLSETALGHSITDNYFIGDTYAPYFKLLTYQYMEMLIRKMLDSIKKKVFLHFGININY